MSAPPSRSGESPPEATPWGLIGLTGALLALRIGFASVLPLTEDEAYYRLWAQAPALGYYDHPPMIAWQIWLGVRLAGDTALGARIVPILGSALVGFLVLDMARLAGAGPRTAERAAIWYNVMPLAAAGGLLAVPDAPAALFWSLALWATLWASGNAALGWWLAAGLAAGLAALSKYSALFLGPGVLIWLASTTRGRGLLRTAGPWLALFVAASVFGLNIWWNAQHHWLTFAKQFGRIAPHGFAPRYLAEFLATEILLVGAPMAPFLVRLMARPRREGPGVPDAWPFLATSLPFLAYLILHSLHDRIQAHWPAPVYPALAICAAFAAEGPGRRWSALRGLVAPFGLGVVAVGAVLVLLPMVGVPLRFDPALPLRGWLRFAQTLEATRRRTGAAWVGTTSYGLAAQLSDQPALEAPVLQISERARWSRLTTGNAAALDRPGLVTDLTRRVDPAILNQCFASARPLGVLNRGLPGEKTKAYAVYLVAGARRDIFKWGCGAGRAGRAAPADAASASWGETQESDSPRHPGPGS
jgi:4-amino-4-deoxy-L-arabinose transferase-like glycosyltransferase